MASRLLGRYARLLSRASSQAPGASAVSARLPQPVAWPAEVLRAQGWPWVTERLMSEEKTVTKDQAITHVPTLTHLDKSVKEATMPEDILMAWAQHGGSSNQAANGLMKWCLLVVASKSTIKEQMKDSRLQDMMTTIHKEVPSVWNTNLVPLLQALWMMDMPSNDPLLTSVQTEILWRVRRLSYKQLSYLVDWGAARKEQMDMAIVAAALKQLELRWIEISDPKTVTALMSKGHHMPPVLVDRLEDKAMELAEGFSMEDIRKVCSSLAAQSRRSVPLLRILSYHFLQKPSPDFTTTVLMDMAFAYGKLNFHNSQVFQRMAAELLPRVPELSPTEVTRYAKSMGFLKWLHIPLFQTFATHYIVNSKDYKTTQICNLLMTFARLGFQPSKTEEFFSKVHSVLEESLSDLEPFLRTDVVWSLCVLQQAKPHYLIPLIKQDHITKLSASTAARAEGYRLKLLHIAATLHLEHLGSSDSDIPSSLTDSPGIASISPLQSSLRQSLISFVGGRPEVLRTGVDTVYGWTLDGEMVVEFDNTPVDMSMLKAPHLPGGGGTNALPAGTRRLAFVVWEFPNFASKSKDLLGRFSMMKRHIQLAGFTMVEVPYYEWLELKTDGHKQAYLKDKIGKAVAEDMAK